MTTDGAPTGALTQPRRPDGNAAARYDGIVRLIAGAHCWHCAGLGWALRDVDIELEQARELGSAGWDAIGEDWAITISRPLRVNPWK
jgi:hypothetical protein